MKSALKKYLPRTLFAWYHRLQLVFVRGSQHQCNICGQKLRRFLPLGEKNQAAKNLIGASYRLAWCPKCYSTDRERLIYHYLHSNSRRLASGNKIKLLHVAPEYNLKKLFRSNPGIEYVTGSLAPQPGEEKIDITDIHYPDNYFDRIICNHVLEHVPNDRLAFRELHRVLKPSGWALLQVPLSDKLVRTFEDPTIITEKDRENHYGQKDHVRIYGQDYPDRACLAGFRSEPYDINKHLPAMEIMKLGINSKEKLFIFIKP